LGAGTGERERLVSWLQEREVREVVMESTAQYWKPVWLDLELHRVKLHLAQAHSNRAPKGRKHDFVWGCQTAGAAVAGRRVDLEFCSGPEPRAWRMMTRGKYQLVRERVRLQNQVEALVDQQIVELDQMAAAALKKHEEAVIRLAQTPGFGVDSAQQIIAEVGVDAESFPSAAQFTSWAARLPGKRGERGAQYQFPFSERQSIRPPYPMSGGTGGG